MCRYAKGRKKTEERGEKRLSRRAANEKGRLRGGSALSLKKGKMGRGGTSKRRGRMREKRGIWGNRLLLSSRYSFGNKLGMDDKAGKKKGQSLRPQKNRTSPVVAEQRGEGKAKGTRRLPG